MVYSESILICIGVPLLVALVFLRRDARHFVSAFLMGMLICLLSGYVSGFINLLTGEELSITALYASPIVEECLKLLPQMFLLFVLRQDDESLLHAGIAIGAGFATFENCCYILQAGAERLAYTLIRGFAVGVMHIVCMLLLNLGLSMARRLKTLSFATILSAFTLSVIFHALYNLLVSRPGANALVGYCLPLFGAGLYYTFYHRMHRPEAEQAERSEITT